METEKKLKDLLKKLPDIDGDPNFPDDITAISKKKNCINELIDYLNSKDNVDSSAVVRFISDPVGDNW